MHIDWGGVPIVMDDGATLVADVLRPAADGVYPVIFNLGLGPFGKGHAFREYTPIQW
jgi:predicted acyl esterase